MNNAESFARDSLAEWSKALASGASPQGRGFEPHSCHFKNACHELTAEQKRMTNIARHEFLTPELLGPAVRGGSFGHTGAGQSAKQTPCTTRLP